MGENYYGPVTICPGIGKNTRNPGTVWGTDPRGTVPGTPNKEQPGPVRPDAQGNKPIWEWQWAQTAMYAYYFAHFMSAHSGYRFVLNEATYAFLTTGVELADKILDKLSVDFRRDYAAGGRLRPDILGFHIGPKSGGYVATLELLEVSTVGQASRTFREDVLYKLQKLRAILTGQELEITRAFSAPPKLQINVGPSKWKPYLDFQRIVPLPLRPDPDGNTYVEWICFQPTFVQNGGIGIDGLLLYEIHSYPIKSPQIPQEVLKRIREMEKRMREQQQVAYGLTLTPWMNTSYLKDNALDRDQLQALAVVSGIGLVALLAVVAAPVIAGAEMTAIMGMAGLLARTAGRQLIQAEVLLTASRLLQSTLQTTFQWSTALGQPIAIP